MVTNMTVCVKPWATVDRTLYVDLKAYLSSVRFNRNVLSTRVAAKAKNNIASHQTLVLEPGAPPFKYSAPADTSMVIVNANNPVRMTLSRESGQIDLGEQTLFVITSSIHSVEFVNTGTATSEVNLIIV